MLLRRRLGQIWVLRYISRIREKEREGAGGTTLVNSSGSWRLLLTTASSWLPPLQRHDHGEVMRQASFSAFNLHLCCPPHKVSPQPLLKGADDLGGTTARLSSHPDGAANRKDLALSLHCSLRLALTQRFTSMARPLLGQGLAPLTAPLRHRTESQSWLPFSNCPHTEARERSQGTKMERYTK